MDPNISGNDVWYNALDWMELVVKRCNSGIAFPPGTHYISLPDENGKPIPMEKFPRLFADAMPFKEANFKVSAEGATGTYLVEPEDHQLEDGVVKESQIPGISSQLGDLRLKAMHDGSFYSLNPVPGDNDNIQPYRGHQCLAIPRPLLLHLGLMAREVHCCLYAKEKKLYEDICKKRFYT